jgi:hypothetical protein
MNYHSVHIALEAGSEVMTANCSSGSGIILLWTAGAFRAAFGPVSYGCLRQLVIWKYRSRQG